MVRMKPERRVGDLLPWTQQLEPLNLESNAEVTETFFTADTVVQYLCLTKTLEGGAEEAVSPVVKEVLHDDGKKYKVTFYKCANFDGWVHDFDRKSPGASKTIEVLDADRELPRVVDGPQRSALLHGKSGRSDAPQPRKHERRVRTSSRQRRRP